MGYDGKQGEGNEVSGGRVGNRGTRKDKVGKTNAKKATLKLGHGVERASKFPHGEVLFLRRSREFRYNMATFPMY